MGFEMEDLGSEPENDSEESSDNPSASYINIREPGHPDSGTGFNSEARAMLSGKAEHLPDDSDLTDAGDGSLAEVVGEDEDGEPITEGRISVSGMASGRGIDNYSGLPDFGDQHDWCSEIVAGLFSAINQEGYQDLFEALYVEPSDLKTWAVQNPDLGQDLLEALVEDETTRKAVIQTLEEFEDDDSEAETDESEAETQEADD